MEHPLLMAGFGVIGGIYKVYAAGLTPLLIGWLAVEINEEIKQKMVEYLQSFEAGIKKAGEFSAEQAPLVVQEFLRWEIVFNGLVGVVMGLLLIVVLAVALRYHVKVDGEEKAFVWLFAVIPLVVFGVAFGTCVERAGKAWIAPRIVVLEKISTLVQ